MPASKSRSRLRTALPVPAVKLFVAFALFTLVSCTDVRRPAMKKAAVNNAKVSVPSGEVFVRAQYPYSIVVGGVYNPEELARARRTDRVVREHYAGFGERPEFKRIGKDLLVYVSYRKHERVYWTRKRHMVKRGEMVLSDGDKLARARCGNQLSEKPQGPVETGGEPDEDVLGAPEVPKTLQALSGTNLPDLPEVSAYVPADGFSDLPKVATPIKGGSIEVPVGAPSGTGPVPSFPNALVRNFSTPVTEETQATTPGVTGQPLPPTETTGGGGGNAPPSGPPTEGVPPFEPPFVPPRPPLAPVPEPNISKSMWLILLGGLACLTIRKSAGIR